ncbi:MAG TPA: hypothetical protein VF268_09540 [Gammaproteobacteria bacterium]
MRVTAQKILAVLALATGNVLATCPNGLPEPCVNLSPLTPSLTPSIDTERLTLPPQIRSFQLGSPPPVAAAVQVAMSAASSPSEKVQQLRRRAAQILAEIQFKGYEVLFQGLTTILSPRPPFSPAAEVKMNEARQLLREYFVVLREIEWITLGIKIGGENYDQRVAQVQIVQGPIENISVDLDPLYSVHRSDAAVHIEDPGPGTPNCRRETVYETKIVDIVVSAGFDERGNPIKRQGRDIEQRPKEVVVCD